jgi:N-glycosylase/DNA lyase
MKSDSLIKIDFITTPINDCLSLNALKKYYIDIKGLLLKREEHFDFVWKNASDEELFAELSFCLFTPQSKAISCWAAVNDLACKGMLFNSTAIQIAKVITKVRFRNNKSKFLIEARKLFTIDGKIQIRQKLNSFEDMQELRRWIIKNIKGIGYKEASHFLRNIGLCKNLAILDRHILKNLVLFGAIKEIPKTLSPTIYESIEKQMQTFSKKIAISMSHLDMVLWCKESGGIFK